MEHPIPSTPWFADSSTPDWRCDPPERGAIDLHRTFPGYAPTPLVELPELAAELGLGRLFVKDESHRFDLGAFKFLGAAWAVHRVLETRPDTTALTCATDGNHGRAVARLGKARGLPVEIFMPRAVPQSVVDRVIAEGADVTVLDADYDDAVDASRRWAAEHPGSVVVQDTSWPGYEDVPQWIVDGYSTIFAELDDQLTAVGAEPTLVSVPVGVGSLAQAAVAHYRSRTGTHHPSIMTVEPDTAPCLLASLQHSRLTSVPTDDTIMNGLNCGTPSALAWPYLSKGADVAVAISDADCRSAISRLEDYDVHSGPSGAAAFAGVCATFTGSDGSDHRDGLFTDATGGGAEHAVVICLCTEGPVG